MDCLIQVVEELDFQSLLNMAQTNKFFADYAGKIYDRKFSNQSIVIDHYSSLNLHKYLEMGQNKLINVMDEYSNLPVKQIVQAYHFDHFYEDDIDAIKITNMHVAFNALKYFGKFIRKLKIITENADAKQTKVISNLLNKYCTESLVELALRIDSGEWYFTNTFENVKHISFERNLPIMKRGMLPMNQTFPALRTLSISLWAANSDYLYSEFPLLEHLRLDLRVCDNTKFVFELFKLNRHVRSVEMLFAKSTHLLLANMILRQLEHVFLGAFSFGLTEGIMFSPSVTKFTMTDILSSPINLVFVRLQMLEIHFCPVRFGDWMEFLEDHSEIIQFHLNYVHMFDECLEQLTIGLFNLQEMTIARLEGEFIGAPTIAQFIENHDRLTKLDLRDACSDADYKRLYDAFKNEWNITYHAEGILFERNNLVQ